MKEIKSDKVFEKKIRIYQINRLEELNDFYQKHKREYKNMNEFLVSLIFAGLDSEINFEKDAKTYFTKAQGISDNVASYNDRYYWNEAPNSKGYIDKAIKIKQVQCWELVREQYKNIKNKYLTSNDHDHPSFICYIEAVNNVYNHLRQKNIIKK